MKVIARHAEGITLNDLEFVIDENNEVMKFNNDEEAVKFLNEHSDVEQTKEEYDEEGIHIIDEEE